MRPEISTSVCGIGNTSCLPTLKLAPNTEAAFPVLTKSKKRSPSMANSNLRSAKIASYNAAPVAVIS